MTTIAVDARVSVCVCRETRVFLFLPQPHRPSSCKIFKIVIFLVASLLFASAVSIQNILGLDVNSVFIVYLVVSTIVCLK